SNSKGAEFKVTFLCNYVVYAFGISLPCSYSGNAHDETLELGLVYLFETTIISIASSVIGVAVIKDDFDLRLTPILHPCSSTRVETSTTTPKPIRIIPGPTGIVQAAKLLKQTDILLGCEGAVMSTQQYVKKAIEDVGDIKNFLNNGKLDQVVAIVKSCSPNVTGDLTVTMKDLSDTIPGIIHHKVVDKGGYENDITVGAALIVANVSVFLLNN
nr:hypothetical protein [Tanacetum cinerariifolium]